MSIPEGKYSCFGFFIECAEVRIRIVLSSEGTEEWRKTQEMRREELFVSTFKIITRYNTL
jgi:hypothetical protein